MFGDLHFRNFNFRLPVPTVTVMSKFESRNFVNETGPKIDPWSQWRIWIEPLKFKNIET